MTDLPDFLLARYAEDEAVAQQAASAEPGAHYSDASQVGAVWLADEGMVVGADDLWEDEGADSLAMDPAAAAHVARHDPARVLAECAAKRRIVMEHASIFGDCSVCASGAGLDHGDVEIDRFRAPCPTVRFLALPYADHEDYREEWRP